MLALTSCDLINPSERTIDCEDRLSFENLIEDERESRDVSIKISFETNGFEVLENVERVFEIGNEKGHVEWSHYLKGIGGCYG